MGYRASPSSTTELPDVSVNTKLGCAGQRKTELNPPQTTHIPLASIKPDPFCGSQGFFRLSSSATPVRGVGERRWH